MNILIIGASGRTGRLVAQAAMAGNHRVTAIIRDQSKATLPGVAKFIIDTLESDKYKSECVTLYS